MAFSRKDNRATPRPIVALTTDYGTRDHYVSALKGVILSIAPDTRIVDVTHEIEPHNVAHGAFVLHQAWPWFPPGSIHVAVVDPDVGSSRRVIVGRYAGRSIVAPDNGLVTFLSRTFPVEAMHVVEDRRFLLAQLSHTFHGRDVMAPVAAHLANGIELRAFGRMTNRLEMLSVKHEADSVGGLLRGDVLHVDRFGTLVTNIRAEQLTGPDEPTRVRRVFVDDQALGPLREVFADVPVGEALGLIGGGGYLEIAVNRGRAVDRFGRAPVVEVR